MTPRTEHIAALLRSARETKALSQRQLSALSGVRQSQISRIEKGTVDLRLSSLIELTRALDLELTLIPRQAVPAVQSMVRTAVTPSANSRQTRRTLKDLRSLEQTIASNFTSLRLQPEELTELQRQLRDLSYFPLTEPERNEIRTARKTIQKYLGDRRSIAAVREALARFRALRNEAAHRSVNQPTPEMTQPAYTLEEDDDA